MPSLPDCRILSSCCNIPVITAGPGSTNRKDPVQTKKNYSDTIINTGPDVTLAKLTSLLSYIVGEVRIVSRPGLVI